MEINILQIVCGILISTIISIGIIKYANEKTDIVNNQLISGNILCFLQICSVAIVGIYLDNSEIIFGTLVGSSMFQLLAINGVSRLMSNRKREYQNSAGSQYLIVCTILLLFLSADYLLSNKVANNILNRIDGGLLVFMFLFYLFLTKVHGNENIKVFRSRKIQNNTVDVNEKTYNSNQKNNKNQKKYNRKEIVQVMATYVIIGLAFAISSILILNGLIKTAVNYNISQYLMGIVGVSICSNIPMIIFFAKNTKSQENRVDTVENVVFTITFLIGVMAVIKPIIVGTYAIYDCILLGVASITYFLLHKKDNHLAGSCLTTVYIAFMVYVLIR